MVAAFAAVSFYAGTIAYFDFQTRNAIDLTIFMQALTSTVHGHPAPFFESYDCLTKARCSFLLVHPSPALYLAAPFYAAAPTPFTLFAIQSLGVGLAAVPLYVLTRTVTSSAGKGLLAAGMYLVWAPTLGGEAFSFHLESFLPLALLTLAALWATGHYRLGLGAAVASYTVLEIAPVFAFFLGAFFLTFALERVLVRGRAGWRRRRAGEAGPGPLRSLYEAAREELRRRDVRYTIVLMAASVVAAVVLFLFMNVWGARLLGVPAPAVPPGLAGVFYDNSSPGVQSVGTVLTSAQWPYTLAFWVALYALVAFVPLLAPRTWLVALPWIGYTFLTDTTRYVEIGSQYTLVAAVPVFFGLAYGLARVPVAAPPDAEDTSPRTVPHRDRPWAMRFRRTASRRSAWAVALVVVVGANLAILPIDPLLADLGIGLTDPFQPGYQDHALVVVPGFPSVERLVDDVPRNATVTAPGPVFSLIANYPYAFVLLGATADANWSRLPFNVTGGPDDVLLDPSAARSLDAGFTTNLSDPGRYGLEAWVGNTTTGPLLLYARGFSGTTALYGPAPPDPVYNWSPQFGGLATGGAGALRPGPSAPFGLAIGTRPGENRTGQLWRAPPGAFLAPGEYTIRVLASVSAVNASFAPHRSILTLKDSGIGVDDESWSYNASAFPSSGWVPLDVDLNLSEPTPAFDLSENVDVVGYEVAVAYVSIQPIAPV
jgi:uncharacterized membrane protein